MQVWKGSCENQPVNCFILIEVSHQEKSVCVHLWRQRELSRARLSWMSRVKPEMEKFPVTLRYSVQHKSVQHKTPRWELSAINSLKWWVCMCALVFSAHRNTLRVVEITPLQLGWFPLQTISVNSHFSHKHTYPHPRDKRRWMWGSQVTSEYKWHSYNDWKYLSTAGSE
jgi:hypothetical protein